MLKITRLDVILALPYVLAALAMAAILALGGR